MEKKIANWGNYPQIDGRLHRVAREADASSALAECPALIARGLGRCYGDSALAKDMLSMPSFNRILEFDAASGRIRCEAGVSIEELLEVFAPRGWFPPVTPGTKFITIGGAIASDVHGKNHHIEGSFCRHVESLRLLRADGSVSECSRSENAELFEASCGGMGLTGVILEASFKLKPVETAYIREETVPARNLDEIMQLFEESAAWTYSVAWIDCLAKGMQLGRSVMMRGEHARKDELSGGRRAEPLKLPRGLKLNVPIQLPSFTLNKLTVSAFNYAIYHKYRNASFISDYNSFFYPLDSIDNWNRIYGRRGFTQYQCVLPRSASHAGMKKILTRISASGMGSFLAVLKLFGPQDDLISFPMEGYTLALDFPISRRLFPLLDELDRIVLDHGGRLYLTKDARMSPQTFAAGYPRATDFKERIRQLDPASKFKSLQSQRLEITK
jgi:decaprenylphospho-beta-D-ribofuranose 2-oxidase